MSLDLLFMCCFKRSFGFLQTKAYKSKTKINFRNFFDISKGEALMYLQRKNQHCIFNLSSVADPDPGSGIGCFLTPGSGIRNRFFPNPGSQAHISESLVTIFGLKSSIILWKLAQIIFHHSLLLLFLDPGSGMGKNQDPG